MSSSRPLIGTVTGWGRIDKYPSIEAENPVSDGPIYRRWPSALRVLARPQLHELHTKESHIVWELCRFLMPDQRRKALRATQESDGIDDDVKFFIDWLYREPNVPLRKWWTGRNAWRSPKEFTGWRSVETECGSPHVEPYEAAISLLPDDISMDKDVLTWHAWCQGVVIESYPMQRDMVTRHAHHTSLREGLRKYITSPWVMFSHAAPFMVPTGVLFSGALYTDACRRLERLLEHPFEASVEELESIFRSPQYPVAYAEAARRRRYGDFLLPRSSTYVGGAVGYLAHQRRSGIWLAERRIAAAKHKRASRARQRQAQQRLKEGL